MAKVVCVLFDDPEHGYPTTYAREEIPTITQYPDGQSTPAPSGIGFSPGQLLGSVSGELGLRGFLESQGHTLVVTSDKDGENSVLARELPDADVVISQPFWPAYLTREQILSVAEHAVMQILTLVRNYLPAHRWVTDERGWNVADSVERAYDLEGMAAGTLGTGRIGLAVLRRLKPFGVQLHYHDKQRLPGEVEQELGLTFHESPQSLAAAVDVVSIHAPLHPETEGLFNDGLIGKMKWGSYIVNTARGRICDRDAIVRALDSGQLAGYAGDVWYPQPPPEDHPWRDMPHHGMTPHVSGATLSAQTRYAAGAREVLEYWFADTPISEPYLVVDRGELAGVGAQSYTRSGGNRS